jgi:hypothetical protein
MENDKLKHFILPIALFFLAIVGLIMYTPKVLEQWQGAKVVEEEIQTKQATVDQKQNLLNEYIAKAEQEKAQEQTNKSEGKPFYKPVMEGMDTEAVIAGEFAEILQLVRANKIKVRSIKYDYDPKDDVFVQNAGANYNVARLNMEMIGNYANYDNFLKELYKHEHFLDIQSAEIVPYKKNKRVLLINFKLKLYAKK